MMPGAPQTAVITGASAGLGRALAVECARAGYRLVLVARSSAGLDETARAVAAAVAAHLRQGCSCIPADITTDPVALAQQVAMALHRDGGRLDLLINNAGVGSQAYFMHEEYQRLQAQIDVNFTAPMLLTRGLRDSLHSGSRILNVASSAGLSPGPGMALYYAAKAAMVSWSRALEFELGEQDIRVTTFCPGPLQTDFTTKAGVTKLQYLRRAPTADQAARAVLRRVHGRGGVYVYPARFRMLSMVQRLVPQRTAVAAVYREQRRRGLKRDF